MKAESLSATGPMFNRIAPRYDWLNRLLSLGQDSGWRHYAARLVKTGPVLDVATGTGDLALAVHAFHPDWEFHGIDIAERMLQLARRKWETRSPNTGSMRLQPGSAEAIPYPDGFFGTVMVAFGIRNVDNRSLALREMARVLRPGGRLMVLEFGTPSHRWFRPLYQAYFRHVLPRVGGWLSDRTAYRYLFDSVQAFPKPDDFVSWMETAGLADVRCHHLSLGIVQLYVGDKPSA